MANKIQRNFLELFAGAGGLSEGFISEGFTPISLIEKDQYCCETLKTRLLYHHLKSTRKLKYYNAYLLGEISKEDFYALAPNNLLDLVLNVEIAQETMPALLKRIKEKLQKQQLDLLLGGPPCQAYSIIGRSVNKLKQGRDNRLYLYEYYRDFLRELKPKIFVFENVPGLLSINEGQLFEKMIRDFKDLGYDINHTILNSADFNVLQNRKRVIVIGSRVGEINFNHLKKIEQKYSISDLFDDLQKIQHSESNNRYRTQASEYLKKTGIRTEKDKVLVLHEARYHNERDIEIYKYVIKKWNTKKERLKYSDLPVHLKTHKNESAFLDRFKVVADNLPTSHTMVAHIAKDGHHYIHPDIEQCRSLSIREAARIQSFPDNYYFEGPRSAKFTQIGNAVPPLLSRALGNFLRRYYGT